MLKEIKSKYILQEIFENINEGKMLQIVKYNKNFHDKLDLSEKNYRKYTQIEIVIDLIKLDRLIKNKFIFINQKEDKSFYHIFFENNKEETKRNYVKRNERITKIKIILEMEIKSLKGLFLDCQCIKSIKFNKFNRNDITDMSSLFENCTELYEVDFQEFKTKNVTNMSYMFYNCISLETIDLSNFVTNNLIYMNNMFSWCGELTDINLRNFTTDKVTDMHEMFSSCSSLENLDISNFNFEKVTNMYHMFSECDSLNSLEIPIIDFNKYKNIDITGMFLDCSEELKEKIKNQNKNITEEAFSHQVNC